MYRLRIRHNTRKILGVVDLGAQTLASARALGAAWTVALGQAWTVTLLDTSGGIERL